VMLKRSLDEDSCVDDVTHSTSNETAAAASILPASDIISCRKMPKFRFLCLYCYTLQITSY